jgi:hypothetical protein
VLDALVGQSLQDDPCAGHETRHNASTLSLAAPPLRLKTLPYPAQEMMREARARTGPSVDGLAK